LSGGYLSNPTGELMNSSRLLTSHEYDHFFVKFHNLDSVDKMFNIISKLQETPSKINKEMFRFIQYNKEYFTSVGLLLPSFLASVNSHMVYEELRLVLSTDDEYQNKYQLSTLIDIMDQRIQRARYEQFIIRLASAYEGYTFYLPAFIDFRGRISRTGILHFHERDLVKSLIHFGYEEKNYTQENNDMLLTILLGATPFIHISM